MIPLQKLVFSWRKSTRRSITAAWLLLALLATRIGLAAAEPRPAKPADLVFRHGSVYTLDASRSWAETVAVSRGRIVHIGSETSVQPWIGRKTVVVDLRGGMLLPSFHDSHVHPIGGGIGFTECELGEATNQQQILERIGAFARARPQAPWIRGGGWQLPVFPAANPHKSLLDPLVPDRPVYLVSADGHSAWVNSRALEIAGIDKNTPDPLPGRIERAAATGEPTGTLREDAMNLVGKHLPKYGREEFLQALRHALKEANRLGITSLQEADAGEEHLQAYKELDERGELTARVTAALAVDAAKGTAQVPRLVQLRRKYQGRLLRATGAKIYADGVIESKTAALLDPYLGSNGDCGKANIEPEAFKGLAAALDREGFQIHIHAIGDRAIRNSLDALEFARQRNGPRDSRHHIAHIQLFHPKDIPRFRQLGVIANFQPLWAFEDPYIKDLTVPVLGPERSRWLYPIHSMAGTGAIIACGSDWPVTSMNPLDAMQVAITRRGLDEGAGIGWIPEETVDLAIVLAGYTINGAYLSFQQTETGSIEVGKSADLVVLNRNLFDTPAQEIYRCKVLLTLFEGKAVYRDQDFEYRGR